ncbi:MAG TPA: VOC family protein [Kofleriaceae bacterium]|jgi:catechol 2,3-dioxygenase-like lactoylglutathione lyase family enzyme
MPVELNHTIVHARNNAESASFYADILGLSPPTKLWHFMVVPLANGVSLDFMETSDDIQPQHYAFLVTEPEFDAIFLRIQQRGLTYYPGPSHANPGQINHLFGGRGVYFEDPAGNFLEVLTRPYSL